MRRRFQFWILVGLSLLLHDDEALGQHKKLLLLSFAAQGDHHTKGGKNENAFEHVHSLAMDAAGQNLFLGAHTGLFKSGDSGRSWQRVALSAKHSHLDVMAVAPHPKDSTMIYLGTHEAGVLKSTDGGRTWAEGNTGLIAAISLFGLSLGAVASGLLNLALVLGCPLGMYLMMRMMIKK